VPFSVHFLSRLTWLNLPGALLFTLLQRTPALHVWSAGVEPVVASPAAHLVRSVFTVAALGTWHALAGATAYVQNPPGNPVPGTVGTPLAVAFTYTGTPSPPQYFAVTGQLPPGLSFVPAPTFGVVRSGTPLISGTPTQAGSYTVNIQGFGLAGNGQPVPIAFTITGSPAPPPVGAYLSNLSIRSTAGSGPQTLIVGVSIGGPGTTGTKNALIRGIGPTLGAFGVTGALTDPRLDVYSGPTVIAANDNWDAVATPVATQSAVGAFALPAGSRDAALIGSNLAAGSYTVQITGVGGATGVALAELYDLTPAASFTAATRRFVNISARTQVGTGGDILITGFNVSGTGQRHLLIRAVGPTLVAFGVTGTLADPRLEVYSGSTVVAVNDDWDAAATPTATQTGVGAFALAPGSRDAALLVSLAPGTYTAQVSGAGGTTGVALVEIYEVP
jgi:hypothetical protein